jgi:hypothetical protein
MQELYTSLNLILLGVHRNTNAEEVANEFRSGLMKAELEIINRKKLFEAEGEGKAWSI